MVDRVLPGHADRLSHLMYKNNRFPWKAVDTRLIAFGTSAAVLLVNWKKENKVLRIYRKSLGKSLQGILEIAGHYKKNYETVHSWYGASPGLVLPLNCLVLYGLPFSIPVAASLQPYIGGKKLDLFEDFSDDELLSLFKKNTQVREQFIFFAEQTIRQWGEGKMCFDFVGRENLMLVNREGNYRLCIADVGIFRFDVVLKKYPHKMVQIEKRMDRLVSLYEMAKEV
jgi:hypothetical protein